MERRQFVKAASSVPLLFSGCLEELENSPQSEEEGQDVRSQQEQVKQPQDEGPQQQQVEQQQPEGDSEPEEEEPVEEIPSIEPMSGNTAPSTEGGLATRTYTFEYERMRGRLNLGMPKPLVEYYESRHRTRRDYGTYIADSYDDYLIQRYADELERFGKKQGLSGNEIVEMAIAFVQQLEYTTDKVNNGFNDYPQYPVETLHQRSGDCEDSSILMASLLRKLGYGTVLLLLPDDKHMAVGLSGEDDIPGTYYEHRGNKFYYVEPTAPGWGVGEKPPGVKGNRAQIQSINDVPVFVFSWVANPVPGGLDVQTNVRNVGTSTNRSAEAVFELGGRSGNVIAKDSASLPRIRPEQNRNVNMNVDAPADRDLRGRLTIQINGHVHDYDETGWHTQS